MKNLPTTETTKKGSFEEAGRGGSGREAQELGLLSFFVDISEGGGILPSEATPYGKEIGKEGDRGILWEGEKEILKEVTTLIFNDERK